MDGVSVSSLITGFASGVISVLTYFSTRSKIRLDMRVEYDKSLHDKRLELYKELWPKTKPLARFESQSVLTYNTVIKVAADTRDWYFKEGGIYLSKRSRKPYFRLKEELQRVIDDKRLEAKPDAELDDEKACNAILRAASRLRTAWQTIYGPDDRLGSDGAGAEHVATGDPCHLHG